MALDPTIRGKLENQIDIGIQSIPQLIATSRTKSFRNHFQIREEADLVLGWITGYILRAFQDFFLIENNRKPNDDEINDAFDLIDKRLPAIKEAIFKCG